MSPVSSKRARHLLSGLIKCSGCGSNYTISGKDYYRCAGQKERGTCGNTVSVRQQPIETATLAILQDRLLTEEHARIFVDEFRRETLRLARLDDRRDEAVEARLRQLEIEIANLTQNFLSGVVSPALAAMLAMREQEKATLEAALAPSTWPRITPALPAPVELMARFNVKVGELRASLDNDAVRPEAAAILATLIESVTIYPRASRVRRRR